MAKKLTAAQKFSMSNWTTGQTPTMLQALGITSKKLETTTLNSIIKNETAGLGNKTGGGNLSQFTGGGGSPSANKALGQKMAAAYGWTGAQWTALNNIVTG